MEGLTLEQLQQMGARPAGDQVTSLANLPPPPQGQQGLSFQDLQAKGAKAPAPAGNLAPSTDPYLTKQGISQPANAGFFEKFLTGATKVAQEVPANVGFAAGEAIGGPVGAGIGAAAGNVLSQGAQLLGGEKQQFDLKQTGKEGVLGLILPPAMGVAGEVLKPVLSPLAKIAGKGLGAMRAILPNISKEAADTISKYPLEVETLAKQSSLPVNSIVERVQSAQKQILEKATTDLNAAKQVFKQSGVPFSYDTNAAVRGINKALQGDFNLQYSKAGLIPIEPGRPMGIGSSERAVLDKVISTVKGARINSPEDLAMLKSQLRDDAKTLFPTANQVGSKKGAAIFQNIIEQLNNYVPKGIQEANAVYSARRTLAQQIQDALIPETKSGLLSPSSLSKIKGLGKEEIRGVYSDLLDGIRKETGLDLGKEVDILKAAQEINPKLQPGKPSGLVDLMRNAAAPMVGQTKIEAAKIGQTPFGEGASKFFSGLKQAGSSFINDLAKPAAKPALKQSLFNLLK